MMHFIDPDEVADKKILLFFLILILLVFLTYGYE